MFWLIFVVSLSFVLFVVVFFLLWFFIFVLLFVFFFHVRVTVSQTLARTTRLAKAVLPTKVIAVCVQLDSRVRFAMKVMPFSKRVIPSKTLLIIETNVKLKSASLKSIWSDFRCWRMCYKKAKLQCRCCLQKYQSIVQLYM